MTLRYRAAEVEAKRLGTQIVPLELPTRFEFAINLETAKTLGRTIPESILVRADDVIE